MFDVLDLNVRLLSIRSFKSKKGNDVNVVDLYIRGLGSFCSFITSDSLYKKVTQLEEGETYDMSFELAVDSQKNLICKLCDVKI